MELKDMILSTLAELEDLNEAKPEVKETKEENKQAVQVELEEDNTSPCGISLEDEKHFCQSMRERILVLFEGFQSPNNKSIEAKVDLTLNFLEYLLAVIDERLESLDKK